MTDRWIPDSEAQLAEALRQAVAERRPLEVVGRGSKRAFGPKVAATTQLRLSGMAGIIACQPENRLVTVKAGTLLEDLETELHKRHHILAFEPADWGPLLGADPGQTSVGGLVAAAIAGPRQMHRGGVVAHLAAVRAVSGLGEILAGDRQANEEAGVLDLPALLTGSHGTLAVLSEITLRLIPQPEASRTVMVVGLDDAAGLAAIAALRGSALPLTAAAHLPAAVADCSAVPAVFQAQSSLTAFRLEGSAAVMADAMTVLLKELAARGPTLDLKGHFSVQFWREIRDVMPMVGDDRPVWRLSLPATAAAAAVAAIGGGDAFYDRGGSQVWLALEGDDPRSNAVHLALAGSGGRATLFRGAAPALPVPLKNAGLAAVSARVKDAFDPHGILNPGRRP